MASVTITEFRDVLKFEGIIQAGMLPPLAGQAVEIGATTAASDAVQDATRLVLIHAEADCFVSAGADPNAETDANHWPMSAGQSDYFGVAADSGLKFAVVERPIPDPD